MIEINNKTRSKIDNNLVRSTAEQFLKSHGRQDQNLSIAFIGDQGIRRLNQEYRQLDCVTDVLSFAGDEDLLGEIIIDYAQIKRQAKKFDNTIKQELVLILVHGFLHLLGYDDETEKEAEEMQKMGEEFIKNLTCN